ncbi:RNA polymerase sigma factor [Kineococcus sp. SYSU DK004]|uniref:RNA polymerase sigma factor n=1 Tax=Kineococcus sp. SYSU DK004 TaxID=3383125 RepID=UPI003D7E093A
MSPPTTREDRFRALYDELRPPLLRFAHRRSDAGTAEDVVADALLVVWRRLDEVPADRDDARAWAYAITRNVLLNQARGRRRRAALGVRLAEVGDREERARRDESEGVVHRVDLARAWRELSDVHQEALGLVVFEELDSPRAAAVLGISAVAFRLRLSRARRALRQHLDHPLPAGRPAAAGPVLRSVP